MTIRLMGIVLVMAMVVFAAIMLLSPLVMASDPAGGWTKCKHIQTGEVIIVEGPRCPSGWMKVY